MVDVSMGDNNLTQRESMLLQPGEYLWNIVSRIDDDGLAGDLIAQNGAVAAQWTDGKTLQDHDSILGDGSEKARNAGYNRAMRIYAAIGALLGWFALVLQLYLMLAQSPRSATAMLATVITFFSFFTILTNLLVALIFIVVTFGWGRWLRSPSVQASAAAYITIVGTIYQLLLRHLWNPQGAQWVADVLLHSILPVGYVLYWLLFAPRAGLRWKDAIAWLLYPAVYLVYILARGAVSGIYPYPFVDVNVLGYGGVLVQAAMLLMVFSGVGLLVVALGRWTRPRWQAETFPTFDR
jgi:hypothetical protein